MKSTRVLAVIVLIFAAFQLVTAHDLCDRVSQIRNLPLKGESGLDANYDALIGAGKSAMPCLIGTITDARKMRDPRSEPGYAGIQVRVGDVAYFVLADIAKTDFVFLLPPRVQRQWQQSGVEAYFNFMQRRTNRTWFQRKLNVWYRKSVAVGAV